jgi:aspartate/methionine/tyrosine aminotransferase
MDAERFVSRRVSGIAPSATVSLNALANKLKAEGKNVVNLTAGEPDFDTLEPVKKAAFAALERGETHYSDSRGILELREAIAGKLARENGLKYDAKKQILVTPGGKQAIFYALTAVLNDGDEAVIPEPCWVSYFDLVKLAGGVPVPVPSTEEQGFKPSVEEVAEKVSRKAKVIMLNSPTNPTGAVWGRQELQEIVDVAVENDLLILSDEMYEKFLYGKEFVSVAALEGAFERTITLNGFSKTHAMTGWRVGYMAGNERIVEECVKLQQQTVTCVPPFVMKAAVEALKHSEEAGKMVQEFRKRRDYFVRELNRVPKMSCRMPDGAFYAFPNIKKTGMSSMEATKFFIEKALVAGVPGSAFGESGEGYTRFSFAAAMEELEKAVAQLKNALSEL